MWNMKYKPIKFRISLMNDPLKITNQTSHPPPFLRDSSLTMSLTRLEDQENYLTGVEAMVT